jgi:hypothetical protein
MFIQFSGQCGQKHEIMDKNLKLWKKISSGKCGQKHEIMDKNIKLWTNISNLLMNIQVNPESVFHVFVYNFMCLSIISCFCPHFSENCMNI